MYIKLLTTFHQIQCGTAEVYASVVMVSETDAET